MGELKRFWQRGFLRSSYTIGAGCAALIALGWGLAFERIDFERNAAIADAVRQNDNLALAFEEHTRRTLRGVDQMVQFIQHQYLDHGNALDANHISGETKLDASSETIVAVISDAGYVVVSTIPGLPRINVADRDYFMFHRDYPDHELRIGTPTIGRLSGRETIHLTRRIQRPDGSFAGVALVGVDPHYFARFYNELNLSVRGMVVLVGLDGVLRARRIGPARLPAREGPAGAMLFSKLAESPVGSYLGEERVDGVRRHVSYRRLQDYPLVVAVGTDRDDVLFEFEERRRNYLMGGWAATLLVSLFAALLLLARRRQQLDFAAKLAAEERYRATFDQAAVGVSLSAPDGRFVRANPAFCRMLGYSEEELQQRTFHGIVHVEDLGRAEQLRKHFVAGNVTAPAIEQRQVRKDGSVLWVSLAVSMVRDADGKPGYFIAMVQDIGKRKQAEEGLRESEARFRSLTELSSDFYWESDAEHRLVQRGSGGKPSAVRIFEEGRQLGLRRWEVAYLSPGDEGWRKHRAALDAREPFRGFEISRAGDDGSERFISLSGDPIFDAAGAFKGYRGVGTDITERRRREKQLQESERRFRDMLGKMQLVSLMLDRDARIHYCNDYLLELTGWKREEVIGQDWFELFIPGDAPGMRQVFVDLLRNEPGAWHHENEILTRSGARRMVRWNNTVLRSIAGEVIGTASIGEDITEQKAAEDQLRDQLDELRRFQKVTVDRELRLQQVEAELRAARTGLTA